VRRYLLRTAAFVVAAGLVAVADACTEQLEGGKACPILCPDQSVELREAVVEAVAVDTTLAAYPAIGEEPLLLLAARGDTLETRVIVRYDTLPTTFQAPNTPTDSEITRVDDARLQIRVRVPAQPSSQPVTIDAYDVDTTVTDSADTTSASMLPLFRDDRLLGSLTFKVSEVADSADSTVDVPIKAAYLLAKIQARARLRVGLLVRASLSAEVVLEGVAQARPESLTFRVSPDQAVARRAALPYSATPAERFIGADLSDFVIVAGRRAPQTPTTILAVGGVPGRRTYLRFNLPARIVDSTNVVRATLLLTQYPNVLAAHGTDSVVLYAQPVLASPLLTDLGKAASLLGDPVPFRLDTLIKTIPAHGGPLSVEMAGLLDRWRQADTTRTSRAVVLRLPGEGVSQDELYFYSTEAAPELRPRLRLVYAPTVGFGLP
jgi:hypothetical protein